MILAHIEEKLRMFREETYEILRDKEQTALREKEHCSEGKQQQGCNQENPTVERGYV